MSHRERKHFKSSGLEAIRLRCWAFMDSRTGKSLPAVVCLTLVACILGVDIHTRRMCRTDRPIVQASAGSVTSTALEDAGTSKAQADTSQASMATPGGGIDFRIGQGSRGIEPDYEQIGVVVFDLKLDVELIRRESDSKAEDSGKR